MQMVGSLVAKPMAGRRTLVIVGSTHPQHKAVKLMNHRRPKKKGADRRHKAAEYAPLPPPPAEYTVVSK
ncbi:hypothetical protein Ndes2437A_g01691 [Nannochloris sp. 'desiccata']|nr:hypothetical protein KSW81_006727 [Chlorella desiccata (nom. nud.)]